MSARGAICLLCLCGLLPGGLGACGGSDAPGVDPDETAEGAALPAESRELPSRHRFAVARARAAFGETVESGRASPETRRGVGDLIRICRRDRDATYGATAMLELLWLSADDLDEAAPALAERLRRESDSGCE